MNSATPEITDKIVEVPALPIGHFWPYYRRLKPVPPLFDRLGNLTVQYRAHVNADEEDPSYKAKFDQTRFVYPIQKTVQQLSRLPASLSIRPLHELDKGSAGPPQPDGNSTTTIAPLPLAKTETSNSKVVAVKDMPTVSSKTAEDSSSKKADTEVPPGPPVNMSRKSNKYEKMDSTKLKNHLREHVRELQQRGVPVGKERVKFLETFTKKLARVKDYENIVRHNNQIHARQWRKIKASRAATLELSVRNAQAVCVQTAAEQMAIVRRFRGQLAAQHQLGGTEEVHHKETVQIATGESFP